MTTTNNMAVSRRRLMQLLAGSAALHAAEPRVTIPPYNTLTDAEEAALGRKFGGELEREMPVLQPSVLDDYINSLLAQLGKTSRRPNLRYVARVINTTDINAVSLPGGYMYVFRGLLHAARTESELVGVLSHEVGHIVGRHSANALMLDFTARKLYEIVKKNLELQNSVIQQIIEKLGGPVVVLAQLRYNRDLELEADMFGMYNMIRAGWDPRGMSSFFKRLSLAGRGDDNWLQDLLATHPAPALRDQRVSAELSGLRVNPNELKQDSLGFQAMQLGLRLLPPPVRPRPAGKH